MAPYHSQAGNTADQAGLPERLRQHLRRIAGHTTPIPYPALARDLGLVPPNTIRQLTDALEVLMREDVAAAQPMIAALVISKSRDGLPAPGFFELAAALGRFQGDPAGPEAAAFHAAEYSAAVAYWRLDEG